MQLKIILCILSLISLIYCAYQPQLMLTVTPDAINKQLSNKYGQKITDLINSYKIENQNGTQTVSGVKVKYNLTNIKQLITINWKANVLKVIDTQTFNIHAKNVNLTLDGNLDLKIGLTRKQKGPLKVLISQLQLSINIKFVSSPCPGGLGFGVQLAEVKLDIRNLSIKIEGKTFDNAVIAQVQKLLVPRLPGLINQTIFETINPLIQKIVCSKIQQKLPVGTQNYIVTINSTEVPSFKNNLLFLGIPLDLTFQNLKTNDTNDQLDKDYLPESNKFSSTTDASIALSSNFLNTLIWLVDDSNLLKLTVTNEMLGPSPPIALNTTNLSILMPKLKEKWPNKEVFLMIQPAGKFEHLLIRSGRLVAVVNLAIKFVVNNTQNPSLDADQCIKSGDCIVACNLNMTLPLTLSLRLNQRTAYGTIHSAQFYSIQKITSLIDINLTTLKAIINEIVGSMIPSINNQLATGMPFPQLINGFLQLLDISEVYQKIFLDFIAAGIKFDL